MDRIKLAFIVLLAGCASIEVRKDPFPELPNVKELHLYRNKGLPKCGKAKRTVGCWFLDSGIMLIDAQYRMRKALEHEKCHATMSLYNLKDVCHLILGEAIQ